MNPRIENEWIGWLPLCLVLGVFLLTAATAGPAPLEAQPGPPAYLREEARRLDAGFLAGISNRQQWEQSRPQARQEYLEMLGLWPLPERTPLNAQVTGTLHRPEGFRVEKVHFQSRPHLYVTGNLYLPEDARAGAKLPAVLYVCGHSGRGRDGNKAAFQHHGAWFATHGYACLIIDTLQLGEIAAIHHGTYRYHRWWWQARGYTPAAVECWNGIRALDYLQSRPEVDPERLAVTGISGGGAATFWIAAADERVKVAVPVSGMSDLEDYVGEKVVNGHCDCMFLINTFQWPWTQIAALVAPRPMLFANSGHDTIFPMNSNERIRSRLERLYGFYTNRTERLFDIAVTPGGHDDKLELRLMAYHWINRPLKGDDTPVAEPAVSKIEDSQLRAFPGDLPADEINSKIDESFVPMFAGKLPENRADFLLWQAEKLGELRRLVFRNLTNNTDRLPSRPDNTGVFSAEAGAVVSWKYFPALHNPAPAQWIVVLGEDESSETKPAWLNPAIAESALLLVSPRASGAARWPDPPPYYIERSLPLLGKTIDTGRLMDVVTATKLAFLGQVGRPAESWSIIGKGQAGVIAAYAAILEPRLREVIAVSPPASHREGPIFLNILRVVDIPEAFGLLAPRTLTVHASDATPFERTKSIYRAGGGTVSIRR